ncbi:flagellin [Sphingomonas aerolata]|jgi:flagellin|uniref:flagellin N-terminal helical domain-containing protein n=1 Tax=Sphingomonas aerolata TaxID=185951 RepID=UPI002FE17E02
MTVIGTNVSSLRAANASSNANLQLSTAMERLSTGKRINSAKDDAAGLAIASSMTSQIRGMNQGIRNANDGLALTQTADGALSEVTNMLQRVRELATQSASGTYSVDDRANIQVEAKQLAEQISSTINLTKFNGVNLFGAAGVSAATTIQTGANATDKISFTVGSLNSLSTLTTVDIGGAATDVAGGVAAANTAIDTVDGLLKTVNTVRAGLGATQSQLQSSVNTMTSNSTNLSDAKSRIEDADFSSETQALAKAQILSQASTAMLAQANQSQQGVLKLLQ